MLGKASVAMKEEVLGRMYAQTEVCSQSVTSLCWQESHLPSHKYCQTSAHTQVFSQVRRCSGSDLGMLSSVNQQQHLYKANATILDSAPHLLGPQA